ncbi:MAG: DNA endonuclease [Cyanobacteria bacterium SBLK]|nr:DNA endonuclease [Cyanobacteria bacterium SBLK]
MDFHVSSKKEQRGILAGMLLGWGRKNGDNFFIQHSLFQEEYLLFKKTLLEGITRKKVSCDRKTLKTGKRVIRIEPKLIPLTRTVIKRLYREGRRTISRKFLDILTLQGIAIWFMDKGSKSFKRKGDRITALEIFLNTHTSRAESEIIVNYFAEVWEIPWGLSKVNDSYRLRLGTKAGKQFCTLLKPYIHPSACHKIETSYNTTATI